MSVFLEDFEFDMVDANTIDWLSISFYFEKDGIDFMFDATGSDNPMIKSNEEKGRLYKAIDVDMLQITEFAVKHPMNGIIKLTRHMSIYEMLSTVQMADKIVVDSFRNEYEVLNQVCVSSVLESLAQSLINEFPNRVSKV